MFTCPEGPGPFQLPISKERLNWQLEVLGRSHQELARRTDVSHSKAANWVSGRSFMPNRLAVWPEMLTQAMLALGKRLLWHRDPRIAAAQHHKVEDQLEHAWDPPGSLRTAPTATLP